jgi:hypothetical protein
MHYVILVLICLLLLMGCNTDRNQSDTNHQTQTDSNESTLPDVTVTEPESSQEEVVDTEPITTEDEVEDTEPVTTEEEVGTTEPENEESESGAIAFNNYKNMSYTIEQNSTYASKKKANYMPELRTVCVDVAVYDSSTVTYIARLGRSSDANESYLTDKIFRVDYSGDTTYLCFNNLEYGEYYIHIIRSVSVNRWATVALTMHYHDEDYTTRSKLTNFAISNKTKEVELGEDPNLTVDLVLDGDKDAIGRLVLKAFDTTTGEVVHRKEFSKDELVFNQNKGTISNYEITGLTPGFKYHVAMIFYPASNIEESILLDTADLNASRITGLGSQAHYHNLYTDIYAMEYGTDTTTFKTYINHKLIDTTTNEPYALSLNVYNNTGELMYSTPIIDQQESVEISNEYLFVGGYATIYVEGLNKELSREYLQRVNLEYSKYVTNEGATFQLRVLPENLVRIDEIKIWYSTSLGDVLLAVHENLELTTDIQELVYNQQMPETSIRYYRYTVTYTKSYFGKEVTQTDSSYSLR